MANSEIFEALSTERLLRLYNNRVRQSTGLITDNLRWLMTEADKLGFEFDSPECVGGLSIDEVSIQVLVLSINFKRSTSVKKQVRFY